ncbi:MAG: sugar transferase [Jatrophihabitans sp.]|uniref:sugar transferase n=1 Tax=Jatrophihabitans sp. TaxID=1932789 RepID=UPI0039166DA5
MTAADLVLAGRRVRRRAAALRRLDKRVFDFAVATVCLVVLSPLLVAIGLLVRATSPGAALFRQVRLGLDGRPFVIYKFRTMFHECPDEIHRRYVAELLSSDQPPTGGARGLFKLETDPRVTRLGAFLRRTSLDELPQLVNVVRGDMSLVGPRPALPWEAALFGGVTHGRFAVAPGITGLWQVSGRSRLPMGRGLELDLAYVRRQSFWFDLVILAKTVPALLRRDDAL